MDWSWWFSIKSAPGDGSLDVRWLLHELAFFTGVIALICAIDCYIFWNNQGVAYIILVCIVNFLVLLGYSASYDSRNKPLSDAFSREQSEEDRQGGSVKQQPNPEKPVAVQRGQPHAPIRLFSRITLRSLCLSLCAFIYAVAMTQQNNTTCSTVEHTDERYQYAVRAEENCHSSIQRKKVTDALVRYVEREMPDSVCGVQCLRVARGGAWEGHVAYGAPTYDWEEYLDQCFSVSKLGQCEHEGLSSA